MDTHTAVTLVGWGTAALMLVLFVPRNRIREAAAVFMFKQLLTWLFGLVVVELGLLVYPERLFPKSTNTSFSFEFFIYPAICVVFNLHYPEGKRLAVRFLYYAAYCTAITVIEVLAEEFTDVIEYIHWTWYWTWITLFLTFIMSRLFYKWFFRIHTKGTASPPPSPG